MEELQEKIESYKLEIETLEKELENLASQPQNDVFIKIRQVEAQRTIDDYTERIERLEKRIAGQSTIKNCPTDEQIALADYVNSREYDN